MLNELINKLSYYQGTTEPTPGKKKYKSETAIQVEPRYDEPLYKNYDYANTEGVDGAPKLGPGTSPYHDISKYKSIKEFLEKNRKKRKAKPHFKHNDGSITTKAYLIKTLLKHAIDFPLDNQELDLLPVSGDNETYSMPSSLNGNGTGDSESYSSALPIGGGMTDRYLPLPDPDGKTPDQLNFSHDLVPIDNLDKINMLLDKYLNPAESPMFGLPEGIFPESDKDADKTVNNINPFYSTTDSGNTSYNNIIY